MTQELPLLDAAIRLDSLPQDGRTLDVIATSEQREKIAERLGILGVQNLTAHLHATPFRGGIRVKGSLSAKLTQECVVSFEPVPETVDEPLERIFLPGTEPAFNGPAGAEIFVDLEGEDLPDHFEGAEVDFSDWILETLALALDPYPRNPGAELATDGDEDDDEAAASPFAKLKSLKPSGD